MLARLSDFPLDDEQGEWLEVEELSNRIGKPIAFNYDGKQIVMPREAARRAYDGLALIFAEDCDEEIKAKFNELRESIGILASVGRKGGECDAEI
jgi:hypothetical protein